MHGKMMMEKKGKEKRNQEKMKKIQDEMIMYECNIYMK